MIFFRVRARELLTREALRAELARVELHPSITEGSGGLAIVLGRWGSVSLDAECAVAMPSGSSGYREGQRSSEYALVAQPSATLLAHAVSHAIGSAALGVVSNPDGTAEIAVGDIERFALRGPVIASDVEAVSALRALEAGDTSKCRVLGSYLRMFVGRDEQSPLRTAFGAWCCRVGLSDDPHALEAATLAASLGIAPQARAARPDAEAAFEIAREEQRHFQRER